MDYKLRCLLWKSHQKTKNVNFVNWFFFKLSSIKGIFEMGFWKIWPNDIQINCLSHTFISVAIILKIGEKQRNQWLTLALFIYLIFEFINNVYQNIERKDKSTKWSLSSSHMIDYVGCKTWIIKILFKLQMKKKSDHIVLRLWIVWTGRNYSENKIDHELIDDTVVL